jgi:four helix bundle protein
MQRQKSGFEKLEVYQLAEELADKIWRCVKTWSPFDRDTVGKQIVRAADSIGANIAEGYGRVTAPDNRRCVRIAVGSLYETKHWLRRAFQRNLLNDAHIEQLRPLIDRLLPMLNGYLNSIGRVRAIPTPDLQPTTHE